MTSEVMDSSVGISIIIPTLNRAASSRKLLKSLDSIEFPSSIRSEILIVDNGSTDETGIFLSTEQAKARKFSLRILREEKKGKANALNLGLTSANGNFILVVDDDVVVHPRWLIQHLECYRITTFDALQGRVLPGVYQEG